MLKAPPSPLVMTLTQGAADAFVQSSLSTGLSGKQAFRLVGYWFQFTGNYGTTNLSEVSFALTRRSKTAVPLASDTDVIDLFGWQALFATSGLLIRDRIFYRRMEVDTPIVEDTIYAQLDSTSTGNTNSCVVRLDVELDSMSEIDRLNLITRSLQ